MIRPDQTDDPVRRAAYIDGLRQLADLLAAEPTLPLPNTGSFDWYVFDLNSRGSDEAAMADQKSAAAGIVRLLPGSQTKQDGNDLFRFEGRIGGLETQVVVNRSAVCERVVTGTETVTKRVPDPSVEVPLVEVTETVETFEWRCAPLLAGGA